MENPPDEKRLRKTSGGRKKKTVHDNTLLSNLKLIVDPLTRGDPVNPLLWTSKSLSKIKAALQEKGHTVGITMIRLELKTLGYSLQSKGTHPQGEERTTQKGRNPARVQVESLPVGAPTGFFYTKTLVKCLVTSRRFW